MALTPKQARFVEEYLVDLNATAAAKRAGYSDKTACEQGSRLLANVKVQTVIQKRREDLQKKTGITQEMVLTELSKVAFHDAGDYQDADLKYSNKLRALELLGKHLGMFDGSGGEEDGGVTLVDDI